MDVVNKWLLLLVRALQCVFKSLLFGFPSPLKKQTIELFLRGFPVKTHALYKRRSEAET